MRQFYIDREFDNFPLHQRRRARAAGWQGGDPARLAFRNRRSHARLQLSDCSAIPARDDIQGRCGSAQPTPPDVKAIGDRFAALEAKNGGMKQLSVRDTTRATIGNATFVVDYGRPLARGRTLVGGIIPYDQVWRTGANAATQFTTSAPITLAGLNLSRGHIHAMDRSPRERSRADREQADRPVGNGLQQVV